MVSVGRERHYDHPSQDTRALASGWLSLLLALEVALTWRTATDWDRALALIRQMSIENLLWGAPRTHGELLKLSFEIAVCTENLNRDVVVMKSAEDRR